MEKPKIAVLTICSKDFNRYKESQPKETHSQLVKISVLKDVESKGIFKIRVAGRKQECDGLSN